VWILIKVASRTLTGVVISVFTRAVDTGTCVWVSRGAFVHCEQFWEMTKICQGV